MEQLTKARQFYCKQRDPQPLSFTSKRMELVHEFNRCVKNGTIVFETVPCLCTHRRFILIARIDRYGLLQNTVICQNCGLVQSMPRMTQQEYNHFYQSDLYREIYDCASVEGFDDEDFYKRVEGAKPRYRFIMTNTNRKTIDSVIEIGCGGGWNLVPFHNSGIKVVGYDYGPSLVSFGHRKGLDLRIGSVENVRSKYDLIILSHVIEHFQHPIEIMAEIVNHLNNDGLIYAEVPDIKRHFSIHQLQNAHTYYFTEQTLLYYMSHIDLKAIRVKSSIIGSHLGVLFRLKKNYEYNNALTEEYRVMEKTIRKHDRYLRFHDLFKALQLIRISNVVRKKLEGKWGGTLLNGLRKIILLMLSYHD